MLQKLGDHIANCLARAADAERRAAEASSEDIRIDNERMAKAWRYLASSYQFAERLERFLLDSDKARSVRPPVAPVPPRKLVIVVDDDPSLLKAVGRLLTAHGFESELFSSVREFHSKAQLYSAECVVLDINLNGESGIEVRRKLSAEWPSMPVIFITGNDGEGVRRSAMEAGCTAYLTKPFSVDSLMIAIEEACDIRQGGDRGTRRAT